MPLNALPHLQCKVAVQNSKEDTNTKPKNRTRTSRSSSNRSQLNENTSPKPLGQELHIGWEGDTCCEPSTGERARSVTRWPPPRSTSPSLLKRRLQACERFCQLGPYLQRTVKVSVQTCCVIISWICWGEEILLRLKRGNPPLTLHYRWLKLQRKLRFAVSIHSFIESSIYL